MNLAHDTSAAMLGYAVLEGVGFALRDAMNSVESPGAAVAACSLVGGGATSEYWAQLLSSILTGSELSALSELRSLAFMLTGIAAKFCGLVSL